MATQGGWATTHFYKHVMGGHPTWMDATQAQLEAANRQASHTSIAGRQYSTNNELLTTGILSIPDADLNMFRREIADSGETNLFLHERKSDVHPFFLDVDMKVECTWRFFSLARALVADAGLDVRAIGACPSFHADLGMPDLTFEHTAAKVGMEIFDQLKTRNKLPGQPQEDVFATWMDIIALGCDEAKLNGPVGNELKAETVIRSVVAIMLMAIGRIVQRTVHEFYPDITPESLQLQTIVLGSHAETGSKSMLCVAKDEHSVKIKIGAHIYMRMLLMESGTALYVWQALVDYCSQHFKDFPSSDSPEIFWASVFDAAPFISSTGGLRMPFSLKAVECTQCKNKPAKRKECVMCNKSGRATVKRFYGPLCLLDGSGVVDLSARTFEKIHNRAWILTMCIVRVPPSAPTKGLVDLTGKSKPANMVELELKNMEREKGARETKRIVAKLERTTGVKSDDPAMAHLLASLNMQNAILGEKASKGKGSREIMLETDRRYAAIKERLPVLCEALFHKCYADMAIRGVSVNMVDGHVSGVIVYIRGAAASRCFNRTFDVNDGEIAGDRPDVKIRGDVDGVPGRHTNWKDTVYFVIDRRQGGTVTQKCCNKQLKQNRRSARATGIGHSASCSAWGGHSMVVGKKWQDVVRSMLFDEQEQTSESCRKMVLDEATRLFRIYRGEAQVSELGPTDDYQTYANKALKATASGMKRRLTEDDLHQAPVAAPSSATSETSIDLRM